MRALGHYSRSCQTHAFFRFDTSKTILSVLSTMESAFCFASIAPIAKSSSSGCWWFGSAPSAPAHTPHGVPCSLRDPHVQVSGAQWRPFWAKKRCDSKWVKPLSLIQSASHLLLIKQTRLQELPWVRMVIPPRPFWFHKSCGLAKPQEVLFFFFKFGRGES